MFYKQRLSARPGPIVLLTALCLSGCNQGGEQTAAPTAAAASPPSANSAMQSIVLRGVPPTTVLVGTQYSFTPTVVGSTTRVLFSIVGQPAWARFDANTGSLIGVPAANDEGTTGRITISASNATSSAAMSPFVIEVKGTDANADSITLSWAAPTENTDGTPVTNLAGYHVHYGTSPGELTKTITVASATSTTCIITGLTEGTYYFAVVAYTEAGTNSGESNLASQTI